MKTTKTPRREEEGETRRQGDKKKFSCSPRRLVSISSWCLGVLVVLLSVTGCSTFNYEWRREAKKPAPTNDITGRWEGTWMSKANGHNGALRCLIWRETNDVLRARYYSTYGGWLHFGYTAFLHPRPSTNGVAFEGEADLGKLAGGVYKYSGYATPTNFFSTYKSKYDHGTFQMTRPTPK